MRFNSVLTFLTYTKYELESMAFSFLFIDTCFSSTVQEKNHHRPMDDKVAEITLVFNFKGTRCESMVSIN